MSNLKKVKEFWEANPLWSGESKYALGSKEFLKNIEKSILMIVLLVNLTKSVTHPFN